MLLAWQAVAVLQFERVRLAVHREQESMMGRRQCETNISRKGQGSPEGWSRSRSQRAACWRHRPRPPPPRPPSPPRGKKRPMRKPATRQAAPVAANECTTCSQCGRTPASGLSVAGLGRHSALQLPQLKRKQVTRQQSQRALLPSKQNESKASPRATQQLAFCLSLCTSSLMGALSPSARRRGAANQPAQRWEAGIAAPPGWASGMQGQLHRAQQAPR